MIRDSEAKEKLVSTVIALLDNENLKQQLAKNISALAITNADDVIANEILTTLGK